MTDKPTPEQIQRACDLANAGGANWTPRDYENQYTMICALADTIAELDAEKARADAAVADLREIDRMLEGQPPINSSLTDAQVIAAPYRVETDPLVEVFRSLPLDGDAGCDKLTDAEWIKVADAARQALAAKGDSRG